MDPLTERDIRASFVNCTQGEAKRLHVPRDLAQRPWADLDFLGWRDPAAADRGYLVVPGKADADKPVGIAVRATTGQSGVAQRNMCSICLTTHTGGGVALMVARKAGPAGRQGNTVGVYMCTDLDCPLYVRRIKTSKAVGGRLPESLTLDEQIARTLDKLAAFVDRVRE
jgi:hypothetical protein